MPLYTFQCISCKHKFTVLQKMNEMYPQCPECGNKTEKLVSAPSGFEFKGNGFYQTDFKNKN